jgi:hypothetical protein
MCRIGARHGRLRDLRNERQRLRMMQLTSPAGFAGKGSCLRLACRLRAQRRCKVMSCISASGSSATTESMASSNSARASFITPSSASERLHRAMVRTVRNRMPGLDARARPPSPGAGASDLHRSLQRGQAPPSTWAQDSGPAGRSGSMFARRRTRSKARHRGWPRP